MAASLLTADRVALHNVAKVRDIITMGKLLAHMGVSVATSEFPAANYAFQAHTISDAVAPYELVRPCALPFLRWARRWHVPGSLKFRFRRMRHRRASRGSAFERSGKNGRDNRDLARLHRGARTERRPVKGRPHRIRKITVTARKIF